MVIMVIMHKTGKRKQPCLVLLTIENKEEDIHPIDMNLCRGTVVKRKNLSKHGGAGAQLGKDGP